MTSKWSGLPIRQDFLSVTALQLLNPCLYVSGRSKSGTCPFTQLAGCNELQLNCMSDDDCPGTKICCQDGCERVCMEPGQSFGSMTLDEPGQCLYRFLCLSRRSQSAV